MERMVGVTKPIGRRRSNVFQLFSGRRGEGEASDEEKSGGVGAGDRAVGDEPRKKEEIKAESGSNRALLLIPRNGSINEMAGQTKPNARSRAIHAARGPLRRVYR